MRYFPLILILLPGCASIEQMSAAQLKAMEGMAVCEQGEFLQGLSATRMSRIYHSIDNTKKGATNKGKTLIKCGAAEMSIDSDVGVPVPPGATTTTNTTTTTVVKPTQ